VAGLQDKNLEMLGITAKRDTGRSVQTGGKDRYFEACWKINVLAMVGVEKSGVLRTERV
jgi:hypothetical protein